MAQPTVYSSKVTAAISNLSKVAVSVGLRYCNLRNSPFKLRLMTTFWSVFDVCDSTDIQ